MSRKSASERYDNKRKEILERETEIFSRNSKGVFETVLAFPGRYAEGMSYLAYQRLFNQLSTWPDTRCERAFFPEKDEYNWRRRAEQPIVTLDTGRPLSECDLLTFSVSFETDFLHVLEMMKLSRIILNSSSRTAKWPVIIATGLSVTANPLPLSAFMDAFIIGESEPSLGPVLDTVKSLGSQGAPKGKILQWLSRLPGIYVPAFHGISKPKVTIIRQWSGAEGIGSFSGTITPDTSPQNLVILELARGCPFNCRFCMPGYIYLPYRERRIEDLEEAISAVPEGASIGLAASSPMSHSCFDEIIKSLKKFGHSILVADHSVDSIEYRANIEKDFDPKVLNMPLEAGSESLRKVIGKNLKDKTILDSFNKIDPKVEKLCIQFQIGLPFETDSDREAIITCIRKIRKITRLPISIQLTPFVPRPWTAFQWSAMAHPRDLKRWIEYLEEQLNKVKDVSVESESPRESHIRALLVRGDHRTTVALEEKLKDVGWNTAFDAAGIDINWVFKKLKPGTAFGWDFLNMGFGYTRLARELQLAMSANQARMKDSEEASQQNTG